MGRDKKKYKPHHREEKRQGKPSRAAAIEIRDTFQCFLSKELTNWSFTWAFSVSCFNIHPQYPPLPHAAFWVKFGYAVVMSVIYLDSILMKIIKTSAKKNNLHHYNAFSTWMIGGPTDRSSSMMLLSCQKTIWDGSSTAHITMTALVCLICFRSP